MTETVFQCFRPATSVFKQLPKAIPFSIFVLLGGFMVMKSKTLKVHNTNRVWKEDGSNFCFLPQGPFQGYYV